ncbi:MAG: fibrobacter succinogenes major paralogous domain-containing protein [Bacteroidetes bacterium]|nr:fibrobacter succinogenes major paralogous domain-containing protein [Bacteroidota bacterium]
MKNLTALLILFFFVFSVQAQNLKDSRDGNTYKTVKIGNQEWMAENLNYNVAGSYCFEDDKANCKTYGRLYTWQAAMKSCPEGWKIPSKDDFLALISHCGGKEAAGAKLTDGGSTGFNAKFTGDYTGDDEFYFGLGENTSFWSSTKANVEDAFTMAIHKDGFNIAVYGNLFQNGYCVRCIKK